MLKTALDLLQVNYSIAGAKVNILVAIPKGSSSTTRPVCPTHATGHCASNDQALTGNAVYFVIGADSSGHQAHYAAIVRLAGRMAPEERLGHKLTAAQAALAILGQVSSVQGQVCGG